MRRRLVADVPLGALLSGGIDSSIVVAAMAQASVEPVRTFTVGFPDARYDERRYARAVAERYGTTHEELEIDAGPELVDRVARAFDEPFGDEAALPTLLVCEATRRHVKVALVGDGGDEVFGGYERYRAHALAGRVPDAAAAAGARLLGAVPRARRQPRSTLFRARRFLDVAAAPAAERYAAWSRCSPLELRRRLWTDDALAHATSAYLPEARDLRRVDIDSYLPGDLLPKADLASMAVSLELRSPFLDHRVVELGLALPPELAAGKAALRQAFADDLPPEVAGRGKTGFGVPLDRWFREELRPLADDLLLGGADRGLFRRGELERLLREHADRRADHGHRLWCLCMLELWQRHAPRRRGGRRSPPRDETPRLRARRRGLRAAAARACCSTSAAASAAAEKSDAWRQVFLRLGHVRLPAGRRRRPTTQPLYGLFLIPVYWVAGRHWWSRRAGPDRSSRSRRRSLVYEIGRRFVSPRAGLIAALIATLQPYLVWHDVHGNREILDQLLGAAAFGLLRSSRRAPYGWPRGGARRRAAASRSSRTRASSCCRLCSPPTCSGEAPAGGRRSLAPVVAGLVLLPVGRAQQGTGRLLHDHDRRAGALEGQQPRDLPTPSRAGSWIDDVPDIPERMVDPVPDKWRTPQEAGVIYTNNGHRIHLDECAQQCALPAPRHHVLAGASRREGEARGAGDLDVVGPAGAGRRE